MFERVQVGLVDSNLIQPPSGIGLLGVMVTYNSLVVLTMLGVTERETERRPGVI